MDVSSLDRVKIQAQVLVPLVKELRKELGDKRANDLVRKALGKIFRGYGKAYWAQKQSDSPNSKIETLIKRYAADGALDYEVGENNDERLNVNITRCGYAEFFKEIGAPDLGFMFCCSADIPMTEGFEAGIELNRRQTIMEGAKFCDFRYKLRATNE